MLTALWPRLAGWHPTYWKEDHVSNSHLDSLLNLMPPIGCFVPLSTGRLVRKLFYPFYRGCPAVSGSALPDHAKHTIGDRLMSINNLREIPIPPHPKGWGLCAATKMKNKRRNETIAAKVLSRFDSGSGNEEV